MSIHGHSLRDRLAERPEALPRPLATGAIYACLAALALGTGLGAGVSPQGVGVLVVSLALAGTLHAGRSALDLSRRRREADSWLRTMSHCPPSSRYAWRAAELTSSRERRILARSLRRLVGELRGRLIPGVVPLNRVKLGPYVPHIELVARRLADLSRPVSPRGILLLHDLLTQPVSPLYDRERADEVPERVASILAALEVD
ncbi:MAG TPA: hypothetical protein VEH79_01795 [Gaiellaceae bacterium]|nr:hypothetical protein [Gaiellaceae bacterium]